MSFETQRTKALNILAKTGIWQSNYAPPALKLLWQLGFQVPPPHFASLWATTFVLGAWFGTFYGLAMWFFVWSSRGMTPLAGAITAVLAGGSFGFLMGIYYAYGRRKYDLPSWQSLADETRT